jgi:branched-chain amino acid transport system substrate-binding protein
VPGPSNAGRAATNGRALIDDNDVMGIIGPRFTEAVKMMLPLMARAHMAFISPAVSNPDVTDPTFDRNLRPTSVSVFFRNISSDVVQASALAHHFSQRLDITSVFGLDDGTPRGAEIVDRLQAAAERARIRWLGRDRLDLQATDLAPILDPIRGLDPRSVYFGGGPEAIGTLGPALHRILPHAVVGTSNVACDALRMSKADVAATAGWYTTTPWAHLVADEATADLRGRLTQATNGGAVDDRMILMYDATQIMIDAIRRAIPTGEDLLPFMVRNALRATKLDTLQGPIEFTPAGDVLAQTASVFQVVEGADGSLRYIERFTQSAAESAFSSPRRRDL